MKARFICLANSIKLGGRCLGGIELDLNNNPLVVNGHPKGLRPICCNTPHGELPTHLVSHINILDIIEIEIINQSNENNHQSENVIFKENSLNVIGRYEINELDKLCDNRNIIFGNKGKALSSEAIANLSYSLMVIKVTKFEVFEKTYDNNPEKPQIRLLFSYNQTLYDFPITDPVFLHRYKSNPNILDEYAKLYISLSLGVNYNDWYYKLVAGIILSDNATPHIVNDDDFNLPF